MFKGFTPKLFEQLRSYKREDLVCDTMAGLSVGIVALPLAIAFGIASGVTPEQGIITAILGGLLVAIFGGSSVQISGPTGAFIVVVVGITQKFGLEGLFVATMLGGALQMLFGFLRLGAIIKFIPYPIVVGFTSGIALTVFSSQAKDFMGMPQDVVIPSGFFQGWSAIFENISQTNLIATAVVVLAIIISVNTKRVTRIIPGSLVAIIITTILVYIFRDALHLINVETIGDRFTISSSIPSPKLPSFDFSRIGELMPSAFTIAFLGAMESLLSTTVADGITGNKTNSNVELVGQGFANFLVPLFGGIPVTGAIARTMTNVTNGGRTPVSAIVHSLLILAVLLVLMPLVQFVPMAALAGVLVIVAYNMSEWRTFRAMIVSRSPDAIVMIITFVLTVAVDLTVAIEIGLLLAALLFMQRITKASSVSLNTDHIETSRGENREIPEGVEVYEIDGPFFFGVANKFDDVMQNSAVRKPRVRVIRMRKVPFIDTTGLHNLELLIKRSMQEGIAIVLSGVNPDVRASLSTNDTISAALKTEDICDHISGALARAREILGE